MEGEGWVCPGPQGGGARKGQTERAYPGGAGGGPAPWPPPRGAGCGGEEKPRAKKKGARAAPQQPQQQGQQPVGARGAEKDEWRARPGRARTWEAGGAQGVPGGHPAGGNLPERWGDYEASPRPLYQHQQHQLHHHQQLGWQQQQQQHPHQHPHQYAHQHQQQQQQQALQQLQQQQGLQQQQQAVGPTGKPRRDPGAALVRRAGAVMFALDPRSRGSSMPLDPASGRAGPRRGAARDVHLRPRGWAHPRGLVQGHRGARQSRGAPASSSGTTPLLMRPCPFHASLLSRAGPLRPSRSVWRSQAPGIPSSL